MRRSIVLFALAVVGLVLSANIALAQEGEAIETFVCESRDNSHNECRYSSSGVVTVHVNRQLSHARCVFNESWGSFDGGVWVDYGCRAEFVVRRPPGESAPRPWGGTLKTVTCESRDRARQLCQIPDIDARSVHLERRLSHADCVQGVSWGVSEGENSPPGIWVAEGCRATFAYATQGASSFTPYGGTPHDFELPCESLRGEWTHCEVPQAYMARIEIIAGNDACRSYKAWGVDDTGIWVRDSCQGAFGVRYRH